MVKPESHRVLVRAYACAVWRDGIAAMGGTLGMILVFLAAYYAFIAKHNVAFLWVLALASFLLAGYRVWLNEKRKLEAELKELTSQLESVLGRPKIIGYFQGVSMIAYGDDSEEVSKDGKVMIMIPGFKKPLGTEVGMKVHIVNSSPTPTKFHNLSLIVRLEDKDYVAPHAEDWVKRDRDDTWMPPDMLEEEKRWPRLVGFLGNHILSQGDALEGGVVFRLSGLHLPEKCNVSISLAVQDAWGVEHLIQDQWGPRPRPLPKPLPKPQGW